MDRKIQAALLFVLAVFIFFAGTKYGDLIIHKEDKIVEETFAENQEVLLEKTDKTKPQEIKQQEDIVIHVSGAVKKPGVYNLKAGARVNDAVRIAIPLAKADINSLNLAEKLQDQQKIIVPLQGEAVQANVINAATAISSPSSPQNKLTNLNTATAEELDALPGIGPAYAERILQYREEHGPFEKIEDIQQVQGIGPKKFEDLKERITVN